MRMDRFLGSKAVEGGGGGGGGVSKVGSARDCQALIPFSRGLLPAPSKLVGPALNTRNTISIGHGHRLSLSDPRFLPRLLRAEGRNDRGERTRAVSNWKMVHHGSTSMHITPPQVFLHLRSPRSFSSRRRRNVSIIRTPFAHRTLSATQMQREIG